MEQLTRKVLIEALGLKPGDKITAKNGRKIFTINDDYHLVSNDGWKYSPYIMMDVEFEKVNTIKVGEKLCSDIECDDCPLYSILCGSVPKDNPSLYDTLEEWHKKCKEDEIYKILKARLDKEMEE